MRNHIYRYCFLLMFDKSFDSDRKYEIDNKENIKNYSIKTSCINVVKKNKRNKLVKSNIIKKLTNICRFPKQFYTGLIKKRFLPKMSAAPVIIEATAKHTSTLIFMHGLGDTGHGWSSALVSIRPSSMKVVCPTAPTMPVSLNAGFQMPSWFDLKTLDIGGPEDENGIKSASQNIHGMINTEIEKGVPANRIVLGGFSQGGALALYSALTYTKPLAGVVALSCWLPLHKSFPAAKVNVDNIPIFQAHGDFDPVVPYKFGQLSASYLKSFMRDVTFKTYRGLSHSSSDEEMEDVKDFLAKWVN